MALRQEALFESGGAGVELERLVADFRRALLRQERSPNTIRIYEWALREFVRFAAVRGVTNSENLTRDLIETWQDHRRQRLGRSSRSIVAAALRQFLRWGVGHGYVDPKAPYWIDRVRGATGKPRPIPSEDLYLVLGYLARRSFAGGLVDLRNRALFLFILATGARVSEALQVTRAQMARAIVRQKGGSEKLLEVPPIVLEALQEYLSERRDDYPWLWVTLDTNHPMRPLTAASVREIWRRIALQLGVKPWTTHQLRHTGATELYQADIDGVVIAEWLGHKGMGHASQYIGVGRRRRQEALNVLQRLIQEHSDTDVLPLSRRKRFPQVER